MAGGIPTINLHRLAIEAALSCQWEKAIEINLQITAEEPENVDCLNRLARAYFELGQYSQSKKNYQQALNLDPYNVIAQKNLKKIGMFQKGNGLPNGNKQPIANIFPSMFIEEPGYTKVVSLIKVAEPQKLVTFVAGQEVNLVVKNRGISVTDINKNYLGALPDDTAHHLIKLIKGGNKYQVFIKSIKLNGLTILIREIFRSKRFKNQASFLNEGKAISYSSHHLPFITDNDKEDGPETEDQAIMDEPSFP